MKNSHTKQDRTVEQELLLTVSRPDIGGSNQQIERLLSKDLDWDYLLAMADRHGVIPLLYGRLNSGCAEIPAHIMARLKDQILKISKTNLALTGELLKFLDCLETEGIEAIPFKGPALALQAYGDLGSRQFTDLDILIRKKDFWRVNELLSERGFHSEPSLSRRQQSSLVRYDCSLPFVNDRGVVLDVHWNFAPLYSSFDIEIEPLWDRLEPITIGNKQCATFSAADLLLILCIHGFTHLWERIGWISDVAAVLNSQKGVDWDLLKRNAVALGTQRVVALGLLLAGDLLHAQVPEETRRSMPADSAVKTVAEQVKQQLFAERISTRGVRSELRLYFRMRDRRRDQIKTYLRLLATPRTNDWMAVSLPHSLFFLYYPLRPLRLAAKFSAAWFRV